jgi:hypothetical protein
MCRVTLLYSSLLEGVKVKEMFRRDCKKTIACVFLKEEMNLVIGNERF